MSARLKARRLRPSPAARLRPFWIAFAFGAALLLAAASFFAFWPGFAPKTILVMGNRSVSAGDILSRAAIDRHRSIWLQNARAVSRRIEAIPEIATASVRRLPPASLTIVVRERAPFAIVQADDGGAIVDRQLRVLGAPSGAQTLPVFVLNGPLSATPGAFVTLRDVAVMRDAYETMLEKGLAPETLSLDRYGELIATMPGGLRLLLGETNDLERKLTLTSAILVQVVGHARRVAVIDLRAPATPVIEYR